MKRIRSTKDPIKANQGIDSYTFTIDEVVQFLSQMVELSDYSISLEETFDGTLQIIVGNSVYQIMDSMPANYL